MGGDGLVHDPGLQILEPEEGLRRHERLGGGIGWQVPIRTKRIRARARLARRRVVGFAVVQPPDRERTCRTRESLSLIHI